MKRRKERGARCAKQSESRTVVKLGKSVEDMPTLPIAENVVDIDAWIACCAHVSNPY